ncbi:MAG TPA: hypothetical protein DGB72_07680 [Gemmatimonadetes bacterium]|jgi:hypothetical protein|nr:hypothetical protein [Gemmatimonadota bacterium]
MMISWVAVEAGGMIWDQSGKRKPRLFTTAELDLGLGIDAAVSLVVSVSANNMPTVGGRPECPQHNFRW